MARSTAVKILLKLIDSKKSLTELRHDIQKIPLQQRPLVQELCFGVARWYYQLNFILQQLVKKIPKQKDLQILLLIGIYQLLHTRIPDYAAINETVKTTKTLNKAWATNLVNAVLRSFLKKRSEIMQTLNDNPEALYAHPQWLITLIAEDWPEQLVSVLEANNQYPPLCLRVNAKKTTREQYHAFLAEQNLSGHNIPFTKQGIELSTKVDVSALPFFHEGYVSIQDGGAQLAAELLHPDAHSQVLDACAAPGGKTAHLLEQQPNLRTLIALDNDANRLSKIETNLQRLGLSAKLISHDATDLTWWDNHYFDYILLDAPCSATGVIRRHPDIKLLRRLEDLGAMVALQYHLLDTLWLTLKPGGVLLYVTCSILKAENEKNILHFIHTHSDCYESDITADWGIKTTAGRQILPGMYSAMDGFYFAKLIKKPN